MFGLIQDWFSWTHSNEGKYAGCLFSSAFRMNICEKRERKQRKNEVHRTDGLIALANTTEISGAKIALSGVPREVKGWAFLLPSQSVPGYGLSWERPVPGRGHSLQLGQILKRLTVKSCWPAQRPSQQHWQQILQETSGGPITETTMDLDLPSPVHLGRSFGVSVLFPRKGLIGLTNL